MSLVLNDSTAMHLGEIIDCRYLTLAIEFYDLDESCTKSLVLDVLDWINRLIDNNFVASWKIDNRSVGIKGFRDKVKETLQKDSMCFFGLEAYWKNEKISTKQQLHQWKSFVQQGTYMTGWPSPGWSVDFADYWNEHILPHAKDKDALKQAFKQLFCEKKRHAIGVCYTPDVEAAIFLRPQEDTRHKYQGKILMYASAFALADRLSETAEMWKEVLISFAKEYRNLDGRVMLQPRALVYPSPYMAYFDDGRKHSQRYLPGVEWANILSPSVQELLTWNESNGPHKTTIECRPLPSGSLLFASHRSILEYDVEDALLLKSWTKEALFPGPGLGYPLSLIMRPARQQGEVMRMPRMDWAIVPIFEEEIEFCGSLLHFHSNAI